MKPRAYYARPVAASLHGEGEIVGPPKPGVTLTGRTAGYAERVGMLEIDVSLTHSHTMAGASCVVRVGD